MVHISNFAVVLVGLGLWLRCVRGRGLNWTKGMRLSVDEVDLRSSVNDKKTFRLSRRRRAGKMSIVSSLICTSFSS